MGDIVLRYETTPEDIDRIVQKHRALYEDEFGFDSAFGDYVEHSLEEKIERIWIAESDASFAGCIGLVEANDRTGQLRWFLVEPEMRGKGVGKALMEAFLEYCRSKGYETIFLWTVDKLPAARSMYERFGFILAEQKPEARIWGQILIEQRWDLSLKRNG